MSALKERAIRHHAQRPRSQQRRPQFWIVMLGQGERSADSCRRPNGVHWLKSASRGVNSNQVSVAERTERRQFIDALQCHHIGAERTTLVGKPRCPNQIIRENVEA